MFTTCMVIFIQFIRCSAEMIDVMTNNRVKWFYGAYIKAERIYDYLFLFRQYAGLWVENIVFPGMTDHGFHGRQVLQCCIC